MCRCWCCLVLVFPLLTLIATPLCVCVCVCCTASLTSHEPGIIVAGCLQEVFQVPFTDAAVVRTVTVAHNSSTSTVKMTREELFHVYGPVRLVTSDIDDWYLNMKNRVLDADVAADAALTPSHYTPYSRDSLSAVARHLVSFHYISEAESSLLFEIFSARSRVEGSNPQEGNDSGSDRGSDRSRDRAWLSAWPRGAAVGDYARPLKSQQEAGALADFINSIDNS